MGLGAVSRPILRLVKAVPGYPALRRRTVLGLRGSASARRVGRAAFPDLLDPKQVDELVREAVREAVAAADERASVARAEAVREAVAAEQAEAAAAMHQQRVKHSTRLKELRSEHKDRLRRTKADVARKEDRRRRALPPVSAGSLVAGLYLADRPLIVFDVRGVEGPTAEAVLEEIALEQVLGCAFRPMFLVGQEDDPAVWRRFGHLCEVIPPEEGWDGVTTYGEYLGRRLESIRADFDARWFVTVAPTGLTQTQRTFLQHCGR